MSCYEIQLSLEGGLEKKMGDKAVEEIRVEQEQETGGVNTKTNKKAKKPDVWWNKRVSLGDSSSPCISAKPAKKKKLASSVEEQKIACYTCIECFLLYLDGKRAEKTTNITRNDSSSIKRHKDRWHKEKTSECTIVPSDAKEINEMRRKATKKEASEVFRVDDINK